MGDPKGFLKTARETPRRRPGRRPDHGLARGLRAVRGRADRAAGGALHGLRHPVLPQRLPARQPHPRVERPGLPVATGRPRPTGCTRPTTSPSSPGGCARRPARPPACSASTPTRSRSSRSRSRSSTGPGRTAASSRSCRRRRTGFTVAVVGSGPAGLAAAQQLTRAGHQVTVFERDDAVGGLLRYGIPEFKMEKRHLDRRLAQMEAEGTRFVTGVAGRVGGAARRVLRGRAGGRRAGRPRPAGARPRAGRHLPGDGVPAAGQPARARLAGQRGGQARGDHRRRRHRRGLPRHLAPPGRGVGDPAGDHAQAAEVPGRTTSRGRPTR